MHKYWSFEHNCQYIRPRYFLPALYIKFHAGAQQQTQEGYLLCNLYKNLQEYKDIKWHEVPCSAKLIKIPREEMIHQKNALSLSWRLLNKEKFHLALFTTKMCP